MLIPALGNLEKAHALCRQERNRTGEGVIHAENNQPKEALRAWVTAYVMAKQMNLAQALDALAKLAPLLGMPEGLEGWEKLAEKFQSGKEPDPPTSDRDA